MTFGFAPGQFGEPAPPPAFTFAAPTHSTQAPTLNSSSPGLVGPSTLGDDMKKLLIDSDFSDVTFVVQGEEFSAHKNILATRSDYFRNMFLANMRESTDNRIPIQDISPGIFRKILEYLYTDTLAQDTSADDVMAVLVQSDKFQLIRLKACCEVMLLTNISVDNAVTVLTQSHAIHAEGLKKRALDVIIENWSNPAIKQSVESIQDAAIMQMIFHHLQTNAVVRARRTEHPPSFAPNGNFSFGN